MTTKKPTIRFSLEPEQKSEIDHYAKVKGFGNSSNLARVALFNYVARNKLTSKQRATAQKNRKGLEEGQG